MIPLGRFWVFRSSSGGFRALFVRQRPDILAAESLLHASSARIGIATAQLYPEITLSAGISASSLNGGALFDPSGLVWSVAGGLTQPIFDGGLRKAQRRAALADFKASAADYRQTVLLSFGQVADVLQALTHDADLLASQQRALELASESERLQRINYGAGGVGLIDLLDAQRQYQQARLGYVRAQASATRTRSSCWWRWAAAGGTRISTRRAAPVVQALLAPAPEPRSTALRRRAARPPTNSNSQWPNATGGRSRGSRGSTAC